MIEKLKNGLNYDLDCGYCRKLADSLSGYIITDREGAKDIEQLRAELDRAKALLKYWYDERYCIPDCNCKECADTREVLGIDEKGGE